MQKIHTKIFLALMILVGFTACDKSNNLGQDNDSVIITPHTVLAGAENGWIVNTNDGKSFKSLFPPDGSPIKMISTAGPNVLMLKSQLFLSDNGGRTFNPLPYNDYNPKPWRQWVLDCANNNRIYIASNDGKGIAYSDDSGRTYQEDLNWQDLTSPNISISSFCETEDGAVYAFSDKYNVLFRKENTSAPWTAVTIEGVFPAISAFYLVTNSRELYIVDYNGLGGVWYSQDKGVSWKHFSNGVLPTDGSERIVGAAVGNGGTVAVATEKDVYFATDYQGFIKANTGLDKATTVYGLTSKYNRYKNGNWVPFLYLATSKGIYRSDDNGFSWDKVTFNEFDFSYPAIY
ncbi:MAG TPA: hypothetical protein VLZ83_09905 [Edaphocola sp.]|nr:hypothetical protein [Edaphocola sp.]